MIRINNNKIQWLRLIVVGLIFLSILIFLIFILFKVLFGSAFNHFDSLSFILMILVTLLFGFVSFKLLIEILFLPFKVTLDEFAECIKIDFLLLGSRTIYVADIELYGSIRLMSRTPSKPRFEGVLIQLKDKRQIQLGEYNLQEYKPIISFLDNYKIQYIGDYKFGFRNYYKNCIK